MPTTQAAGVYAEAALAGATQALAFLGAEVAYAPSRGAAEFVGAEVAYVPAPTPPSVAVRTATGNELRFPW